MLKKKLIAFLAFISLSNCSSNNDKNKMPENFESAENLYREARAHFDKQEYVLKNHWAQIREYRDKLLVESDWSQGTDVPSTLKAKWATYRQALRDVPSASSPDKVVWPTAPS